MEMVKRFAVYLVNLDPVQGSEIAKTRPCVVISPASMNMSVRTVIVAPLSSADKGWPSRIKSDFGGKPGEVALDQIRTVDKTRLVRRLGDIDEATARVVCNTLHEMFAFE